MFLLLLHMLHLPIALFLASINKVHSVVVSFLYLELPVLVIVSIGAIFSDPGVWVVGDKKSVTCFRVMLGSIMDFSDKSGTFTVCRGMPLAFTDRTVEVLGCHLAFAGAVVPAAPSAYVSFQLAFLGYVAILLTLHALLWVFLVSVSVHPFSPH